MATAAASSSSSSANKRPLAVEANASTGDDSGRDKRQTHDEEGSAASAASPHSQQQQALDDSGYIFWELDACSYKRADLLVVLERMLQMAEPRRHGATIILDYVALTPHGASYGFHTVSTRQEPPPAPPSLVDDDTRRCSYTYRRPTPDEAMSYLARWDHTLYLDRSRSLGATDECPLTCDAYVEPYLLSRNKRSYSRAAIVDAIEKTLKRGLPLRLEDCTIHFSELPTIYLVPNHGLPGWDGTRFSERAKIVYSHEDMHVYPCFDEAAAKARTYDEASTWLDSAVEENPYHLLSETTVALFRSRRPEMPAEGVLFDDLVLRHVVWPRDHIKGPYPLVFSNVEFVECIIRHHCFCGIKMYGCRFTRCIFIESLVHSEGEWQSCEYVNCMWVFTAQPSSMRPGEWFIERSHSDLTVERIEQDREPLELPNMGAQVVWHHRFVCHAKALPEAPVRESFDQLMRTIEVATKNIEQPRDKEERARFKECMRYNRSAHEWRPIVASETAASSADV